VKKMVTTSVLFSKADLEFCRFAFFFFCQPRMFSSLRPGDVLRICRLMLSQTACCFAVDPATLLFFPSFVTLPSKAASSATPRLGRRGDVRRSVESALGLRPPRLEGAEVHER
jgi:hypothetical protein